MPTFLLYIKAELDNVASLSLDPGASFCFDVKESAGTEVRQGVYISPAEEHELSGGKGTANFVLKFSRDSKECSCNVVKLKGVTRAYTADDAEQFVPIAAFECRGLEPVKFSPEGGWNVQSGGGQKYQDIDLSEGEWCDYDEKSGASVGVYKIDSKFELHRG